MNGLDGRAAAALLLNALVFGLSWWPFRWLQAHGLHPLWATFYTYTLALTVLLSAQPQVLRAFARHPALWWLLLSSGLTNLGFNWAITVGDVVRVVILFYLMPAWVVGVAWWLLGERPSVGALLRVALALTGVVLVLKTPGSPWPVPQSLPDGLALMAGFFFATTNVLLRRLHATPESARVFAMFGGGALVAAAVAGLGSLQGFVTPWPPWDSAWVLAGVGFSVALLLANLGLQYGAARLSAHATSLIMLSEVVFATVSSVVLGVAALNFQVLMGGSLILLAAGLAAWS